MMHGRRRTEAVLLDIDTVQIEIPNDTPINDRVYLVAPTHPLRLLWHLQTKFAGKNLARTGNANRSTKGS